MNKKVLKTAIIISWIVLAVCFIIKIFGGKYFDIVATNNTFNTVCTFVDNHLWLQDIIAFCTTLLAVGLLNLAVLKQRKFNRKQIIFVIICTIIEFAVTVVAEYLKNDTLSLIGFILSILPFCICPMILSKKPLRSILAYILYVAFQAISVIVKGLAITKINSESSFVALIFTIDVYIMLTLYYLHANLRQCNKEDKMNKVIETINK